MWAATGDAGGLGWAYRSYSRDYIQKSFRRGRVYLETALGSGLVHTQDMLQSADAIERGLRVPQEVLAKDLQARFGYVRSSQGVNEVLLKE